MSSKKCSLMSKGYAKLASKTPLVQKLQETQNEKDLLYLIDELLAPLPVETILSLIRFLKFCPDLAMSLLLFYEHDEVVKKYKHCSLNEQFQIGMRHFCLREPKWSKKERQISREMRQHLPNIYCPDELPDELKPYYQISNELFRKHRSVQWMPPYDNLLKKCPKIWFIDNELLEFLILGMKASVYKIDFLVDKTYPEHRELLLDLEAEGYTNQIANHINSVLAKNEELADAELLFYYGYYHLPSNSLNAY